MSYPRAYVYAMAALSVVLVAVRWLWGVPVDVWQLLLLVAVHTILATRTIALPSGLVLNAGVPLANAAMALLRPWDAALVVVPGAIAVSVQRRRPWPLALTNLTATALPSLIGSWLYYQLLGFLPDGGAWRLVAFLPAILMRDLVNLLVLLPVLQHRQRKPWLAVLTGSLRERGWGPLTLNLVGFAVAELVRQSGPLLLLYAMVVLLGLHRAVEFHLRRSEVQRAAERDGLTMARNRYTFERVARQVDWTGAVAVMDCNGLKRLNDSAGHQAGDAALRALTTTLVGAAGEEHVYRYGGDEFVVLLHDPARLEALAAALDEFNRTARISVSLGTCLVPQEAADIPAAFALADSRMYGVKGAYPAAQQPAAALQRSLEDTLELIRPLLSLAAEQTGAAIGVRSPAGSWPLRCGPGDGPSEAELFRLPAASRRSGEARARQHRLQLGDGWLLVMQEPPALPPDRSNLLQTTSATVRRIWQQGSRQRLINLVFAAAVSGHDLETSLEHMEREITRHVPFDRFRLLLLDESRRLLDVYERLSTADLNPSPRQLDLGRATQAAAAIETGQPVQSPELAESTGGVRTLLAVPLLTGQHVFGVAEFSSRRPRQFTQSDVELLCTVAAAMSPGLRNVQLFQQQRRLSAVEPLTGLYTRHHLSRLCEERSCDHTPLSILLVDFRNFTAFNDHHGLLAGDQQLAALAEILRRTTRPDDLLFRFDGDEFLVVLPVFSAAAAQTVGERILAAVQADASPVAAELRQQIAIGTAAGSWAEMAETLVAAEKTLVSAKRPQAEQRLVIGGLLHEVVSASSA